MQKTLLMLELMPGDEYDATLRCFLLDQLKRGCPEENCSVASCAPGTVEQKFLDMALEVDLRAKETIENRAAVEQRYAKCGYIALRSLKFVQNNQEPYELGFLMMVFRTRGEVLRRFVVPDLDEETPTYVLDMLGNDIGEAHATLPTAKATATEEIVAGKLADSVMGAFRDLAEYFQSTLS